MKKVALLFAGQGAQYAQMGLQTIAETPLLQPYAETIQSSLSFSLSTILASTDGSLNLTKYTQPSVLATSLLLYRQLQTLFPITFDYVAGFSLGEFTALHIAGYLALPSVLSLITLRAETMDAIANKSPGFGVDTKFAIGLATIRACLQYQFFSRFPELPALE
jgi:[acyl-carrier-protein] S-malonyltransferase